MKRYGWRRNEPFSDANKRRKIDHVRSPTMMTTNADVSAHFQAQAQSFSTAG
jgi:hypothetical protein